jgi:hypothetical protein
VSQGEPEAGGKQALVALICGECQFYKESDADLECGAFVILERLLLEGKISPADIDRVLSR